MKEQRSLRGKIWHETFSLTSKETLQQAVFKARLGDTNPVQYAHPTISDLLDPFQLRDMDKAVNRINAAIENQERIMVFGDFDADGITSTVILVHALQRLVAAVSYRIPDRVNDSHGLKTHLIDEIASTGTKLIITVDCGVNDYKAVAYAQALGIEVIILDHHKVDPDRWASNAVAVVNPMHHDCTYPCQNLAGVGVTFKVLQALNDDSVWLEPYLALVAVGTVADCVPLSSESRTMVQLGLEALNKNHWPGVTALIDSGSRIDAETISFQLAPCLNAASRLGQVQQAVQLFLGDHGKTADRVAYLKNLNDERRHLTQEFCGEAEILVQPEQAAQILFLETCPVGVLGLVASRLVERLAQPILVLTRHPHGALHGSARAPKGLNMAQALEHVSPLLINFGGHAGAAGFQLEESQLASFIEALQNYFRNQPKAVTAIHCEGKVKPAWLDLAWHAWQQRMEPYGMGNPKPLWLLKSLKLEAVRSLGKSGQHARFLFATNHEMVAFFCEDLLTNVKPGQHYDVVLTVNQNHWQGQTKVQWHLVDLRIV